LPVAIVADTGPLNYLILIGEIDVLQSLFGSVVVPSTVAAELRHPKTPPAVRQWIAAPPDWVEIRLSHDQAQSACLTRLGAGEKAAILLALAMNAESILLDDRAGIAAAHLKGLKVLRTLGVLLMAAKAGLLDLPTAVSQLRKTTFRCTEELYTQLLAEAGKTGESR
jgi:predicted nucleic acid-binding protein